MAEAPRQPAQRIGGEEALRVARAIDGLVADGEVPDASEVLRRASLQAQQDLQLTIAAKVFRALHGTPWASVGVMCSAGSGAGPTTSSSVEARDASGQLVPAPAPDLREDWDALRRAMTDARTGTWRTAELRLRADGQMAYAFGYDEPADQPADQHGRPEQDEDGRVPLFEAKPQLVDAAARYLRTDRATVLAHHRDLPDDDAVHACVPVRGGASVIIDCDGSVLWASSSVPPAQHLEAFRQGRRTDPAAFD